MAVPPGEGVAGGSGSLPSGSQGFVILVICWQVGQLGQGDRTDISTPADSPLVLDKLIFMLGRL